MKIILSLVASIIISSVLLLIGYNKGQHDTEQKYQQKNQKIKSIIASGKPGVSGDFILTPDKKWTPENPVTLIWIKENHKISIAGAGHQGYVKVWNEKRH